MSQTPPLVSLVIAIYNVAPYLDECVASACAQDYANLEIILIDDGSTDGGGEICERWAKRDDRIRVIRQTNRGLSAVRNLGIDIAKGKFVGFLDGDDSAKPTMIRSMLSALLDADADIAVCGYNVCRANGKTRVARFKAGRFSKDELLSRLVREQIDNTPWNKLYRRKVFAGVRYPKGRVFEGAATTHLILANCVRGGVVVEDALFDYRYRRPGSIQTRRDYAAVRDGLSALEDRVDFVAKYLPNEFKFEAANLARSYITAFCKANGANSDRPSADELAALRDKAWQNKKYLRARDWKARCLLILTRFNPSAATKLYRAYDALRGQFQI